jgi:TPR repeat protein
MYYNGYGVPKSYVLSYVWASIAAANGHEEARARLGDLERRMTPAQIGEAQREAKRGFDEIKGK